MVTKTNRKNEKKSPGTFPGKSALHDAAEKKLIHSPRVQPDRNGQTSEEIIHELEVHQIELEMQAEELRGAHLALEVSRDQYLDLYEFAPLGYLTLTDTALISQSNLTAAVLLGTDRSKLINARFRRWVISEDLETWDRYFMNLMQSENKLSATLQLKRGEGTTFPARLESIRLTGSNRGHAIRVAISDISDIRNAETELRTSENRIRLQARMLDSVGDAVIAVDNDHKIIFWNEAATRMYGWKTEEVIGQNTIGIIVPDVLDQDAKKIFQHLEKGESWSGEYRVRHRDGHEFPVHVTDSPVFDDKGNIIAIIGASHDISEQKIASDRVKKNEENLLRAQELLEAVTKGTDVIIAAQDLNFRYIFFNQAYKEKIEKITGKELTLGTSMVDLFADVPEEQVMTINEWTKVMLGENVNQMIKFHDPGNQSRSYHVLHIPLRDSQGTIVGAGEVAYDITTQVQVEDKLRETKEYLDNLITYANAPIIVWDPEFRITRFNQAFEHLTGRTMKEVIGQPFECLLPKNCLNAAMELIRKTMDGERWDSVEIPILNKNGGTSTVLWNSANIFGSNGTTIISTIAQGQDISARKKAESVTRKRAIEFEALNTTLNEEIKQRNITDNKLKNTLSLLNASFEATADGICVVDKQEMITGYNKNFISMWNIPPALLESRKNEPVVHYLLSQLKNPEGIISSHEDLDNHVGRESFDTIEFIDGRTFERYSKPQKIGEIIVGRVWSYRDVTERKLAKEKLVASLEEKEVLIREIHHRVKNNLQLITGLLDMTRMRTSDETTNSVLTDIMLKIQTMAQIHTRLYESKQIGRISITGQFRDQVAALADIYSYKGHEIRCEINTMEVFLPVDQALPCALVVNEVLSNAYKHAFKGRKEGRIVIFAGQENGRIKISIHDDGIGLPDNFDISRSNSLGLKLIRTLVEHQLKGSLGVKNRNGTEISIEFPEMIAGT